MKNNINIIITFFIILQYSCNAQHKNLELIKENIYKNSKGQLFMKLSNKSVMHPSLEGKRKDTIYRNLFYYNYDSIVKLEEILNLNKYHTLITDEKFSDNKYIFKSTFYKPGKRMYSVKLNK